MGLNKNASFSDSSLFLIVQWTFSMLLPGIHPSPPAPSTCKQLTFSHMVHKPLVSVLQAICVWEQFNLLKESFCPPSAVLFHVLFSQLLVADMQL